MEIKIGVVDSPRELVVSSSQSAEEIESLVASSLDGSASLLNLTDDKGRRYIVPSSRVAYVEIVPAESRRVGFVVGD